MMKHDFIFPKILTVFLMVLILIPSCSRKGTDDGSESPVTEPDNATLPRSGTNPTSPSSVSLVPEVTGIPSAVANLTALSASVGGAQVQQYRYILLTDRNDCADATYGDWTPVTVEIDANLGEDGPKILCLMVSGSNDTGAILLGSAYYRWIKDTVNPTVTINSLSGLGPYYTSGGQTTFSGVITDANSVSSASISLQKNGGLCLNASQSAFDTSCPNAIPLTLNGQGQWILSVNDTLFQSDASYTVSVTALDQANNSGTASTEGIWDITPPSSPTNLVVTDSPEQLPLSWRAATGANSYIVVRRPSAAVTAAPEAGTTYTRGHLLNAEQAIAYAGPDASFTDTGLSPYVRYYYAVYAQDLAGNLSGPATGNGYTSELPHFRGIQYAAMVAPDKTMMIEWMPFNDGVISAANLSYELYVSTNAGGQNFNAAPATAQTGGSRMYYKYTGSANMIYLVLRARKPNGELDANTKEFALRVGNNAHHKIAHSGRTDGLDGLSTYVNNGWAISRDNWGNLVFVGDNGVLNVNCMENTNAPYCLGRTISKVYTIVGTDGRGNTTSSRPGSWTSTGQIVSIAIDSYGNIYLGDSTNNMVRAICYAPIAPGFCNARTPGYHLIVTGTGIAGDGAHDTVASLSLIGVPNGLALDNYGNLFIGDSTYRRLRAVCFNNTGGYCNGRTVNNIYRVAGTGALADGADAVVADSTLGLGDFGAITFDAGNNLYITDTNYRRIRVICNSIGSNDGFCNGKSVGRHYRVMGTGVAGDGGDGVVASTAAIGQSFGISVDPNRNIYFSDLTYPRVRVICESTNGSGFCSDKVTGNTYQYSGTGVTTTSGTDGLHRVLAGLGDPRGLTFDGSNNLLVVDSRYKYIRLLCQDNNSDQLCINRTPSNHYLYLGNGAATGSADYVHALYNPLGTLQGTAIDPNGNVYLADSAGFRIRVICYNTAVYPCINKTYAYNYYVAGTGVTGDGIDGSAVIRAVGAVYGMASDSQGNIYFGDTTARRVRVLCQNTTFGFCNGKVKGSTYRIAGTGAAGDGVDNAVAASTAMGMPYDLTVDSAGNIFVADFDYRRIRAICIASSGYCSGKSIGNSYRLGGSGTAGDGADNSVATTNNMGAPQAIALDTAENIFFADATYFRIRTVCNNTTSGFCQGKTSGNMYRYVGTGITGNAADDVPASTNPIGTVAALTFDNYGNLFLADTTNLYIRTVCNEVSSNGFCQGRTLGNLYRMIGSGTNREGESNTSGTATDLGAAGFGGMKFTSGGHLLRVDGYNSLRVFLSP